MLRWHINTKERRAFLSSLIAFLAQNLSLLSHNVVFTFGGGYCHTSDIKVYWLSKGSATRPIDTPTNFEAAKVVQVLRQKRNRYHSWIEGRIRKNLQCYHWLQKGGDNV